MIHIPVSQKEIRLGEENINRYDTRMKIIQYNNATDIVVEFLDDNHYVKHTDYREFQRGTVSSPFDKTIYGIGYIGEEGITEKEKMAYKTWYSMMKRCYREKDFKEHPTYIRCEVCPEWHNFMNFLSWYKNNYYQIEGDTMEIDKDIIEKGNKMYHPDKCVFVNSRINTLFTNKRAKRGKCLIGVCYVKKNGMYQASCNDENGKSKFLGYFVNEIDAYREYKKYKESVIKKVADVYKNDIPQKLYDALYNYKIDITD